MRFCLQSERHSEHSQEDKAQHHHAANESDKAKDKAGASTDAAAAAASPLGVAASDGGSGCSRRRGVNATAPLHSTLII
jgi:hypothetical protein